MITKNDSTMHANKKLYHHTPPKRPTYGLEQVCGKNDSTKTYTPRDFSRTCKRCGKPNPYNKTFCSDECMWSRTSEKHPTGNNDSTPQIKKYMKNGESWVKTTRNVTAKYEPKPHTITEGIDMKSKKYQDAVKEAARISTAEQWESIKEGIRKEERERIVKSLRESMVLKPCPECSRRSCEYNEHNKAIRKLYKKLDKLK